VWVARLKNSLSVEHPIAGDELRAIKRYLATREDNLPWLFVSERGQPMTRQAVNYLKFADQPGALPSDFVGRRKAEKCAEQVHKLMVKADVMRFGACVYGMAEYPTKLRHAAYPVELLYYRGIWDLVFSRSVAVVGTRQPSNEGRFRTRRSSANSSRT